MYIERDLEPRLAEALRGSKVLILYGSRQTGKTTVVERLLSAPDIRREGESLDESLVEFYRQIELDNREEEEDLS